MLQRETAGPSEDRRKSVSLLPSTSSTTCSIIPLLALGVHFPSAGHCASAPGVFSHVIGWVDGEGRTRPRGSSQMTLTAVERGCAEQLARFFPKLPLVRIPVEVVALRLGQKRLRESTVVEYGTREYAIFPSNLALEFDDRVRLIREGMGKPAEAAVIALQYHEGSKAVAVRFLEGPCDWMVHP